MCGEVEADRRGSTGVILATAHVDFGDVVPCSDVQPAGQGSVKLVAGTLGAIIDSTTHGSVRHLILGENKVPFLDTLSLLVPMRKPRPPLKSGCMLSAHVCVLETEAASLRLAQLVRQALPGSMC